MKGSIFKSVAVALFALASHLAHAGTVTYVYTDSQGTPLAEANASGAITATFDYKPYGSQVLGSPKAGPGYTGHVNDPDTGFVYMQARYYDPAVGRFLSSDPVRPSAGNLFNINRYGYANGGPTNHTDPDGRQIAGTINNDKVDWNERATTNTIIFGYLIFGVNIESHNKPGDDSIQSVVTPFEFGAASKATSLGELALSRTAAVGELRSAQEAVQGAASSGFFQGASYSPKVISQMARGPGEFHSFPESVAAFEKDGAVSNIIGGDGNIYQKLDIPGSYASPSGNTYSGSFQFIKSDNVINHRLFVPEKQAPSQ